eukprot:gene17344-20691_t
MEQVQRRLSELSFKSYRPKTDSYFCQVEKKLELWKSRLQASAPIIDFKECENVSPDKVVLQDDKVDDFKEPKSQDGPVEEAKDSEEFIFQDCDEETIIGAPVNQLDQIYCIGGINTSRSTYIYRIATNKWRKGPDMLRERREPGNVVYTGTSIYVFSGNSDIDSYERFDIATQSWDHIGSFKGSKLHSVSYNDSDGTICILGGNDSSSGNLYSTYGVSRLTQLCTKTLTTKDGDPHYKVYGSSSFIHQGRLYTLGGLEYAFNHRKDISTINLETLETSTFIDNIFAKQSIFSCPTHSCFDGEEYIYIISNFAEFIRVSIVTKEIKTLERPLMYSRSTHFSLVYCRGRKNIYHIYKNRLYCYSIENNKWSKMASPSEKLESCGIVGV